MQRTVRGAFAECTVLTVAHRLHTIIDYDRILVLEQGQALEFGSPQDLMQVLESFMCVISHVWKQCQALEFGSLRMLCSFWAA